MTFEKKRKEKQNIALACTFALSDYIYMFLTQYGILPKQFTLLYNNQDRYVFKSTCYLLSKALNAKGNPKAMANP